MIVSLSRPIVFHTEQSTLHRNSLQILKSPEAESANGTSTNDAFGSAAAVGAGWLAVASASLNDDDNDGDSDGAMSALIYIYDVTKIDEIHKLNITLRGALATLVLVVAAVRLIN